MYALDVGFPFEPAPDRRGHEQDQADECQPQQALHHEAEYRKDKPNDKQCDDNSHEGSLGPALSLLIQAQRPAMFQIT